MKRTLKLTHKQIELLQQALGLAEAKFFDIRQDLAKVHNVRNNGLYCTDQKTHADYYHKLSCEFATLNSEIQEGVLDV